MQDQGGTKSIPHRMESCWTSQVVIFKHVHKLFDISSLWRWRGLSLFSMTVGWFGDMLLMNPMWWVCVWPRMLDQTLWLPPCLLSQMPCCKDSCRYHVSHLGIRFSGPSQAFRWYSPGWHLACSLMRYPEPEPSSSATPGFLAHRYGEIININRFKLLSFEEICYMQ